MYACAPGADRSGSAEGGKGRHVSRPVAALTAMMALSSLTTGLPRTTKLIVGLGCAVVADALTRQVDLRRSPPSDT